VSRVAPKELIRSLRVNPFSDNRSSLFQCYTQKTNKNLGINGIIYGKRVFYQIDFDILS